MKKFLLVSIFAIMCLFTFNISNVSAKIPLVLDLYELTYDCGSGTGTPPTGDIYEPGDIVTIKSNTCTPPSGVAFSHWDCGGTNVSENSAFTINANTTCTAQYGSPDYTVTYSCGSGTGTPPASSGVVSGVSFSPAFGTGCRDGSMKRLDGWLISGTDTVVYPGESFVWNYSENKTFTAQYSLPKLVITTTNINWGDKVTVYINAYGKYSVSCDAGFLSEEGDGSGYYDFSCDYQIGNLTMQTIYVWGRTIKYKPNATKTVFVQAGKTLIRGISGDLSALFPYYGSGSGQYPSFKQFCYNCTNLESISDNLFSGYTEGVNGMFDQTFSGCSSLTGYISPTLFDGLIKNNASTSVFSNTFTNTSMDATCPTGTTQYAAGYTSSWGSKVSCQPDTVNYPETVNVTFDGASPTMCTLGNTFVPPTPTPRSGYVFAGWKAVPCGDKIKRQNTATNGTAYGYARLTSDAGSNESNYGLTTGGGEWVVEFPYGTIWGRSTCNYTLGEYGVVGTPTLANDGTYCWCQISGFTASGNSYTSGPQCTTGTSRQWVCQPVFFGGDSNNCRGYCASVCASRFKDYSDFRTALFNAIE